ncbi:MAG: hypothetical protein KBI07_02825 [Candidatus Atribacteria bacterium]|nr:hypothetical protein [Candidatus Atribacteria bacterium]
MKKILITLLVFSLLTVAGCSGGNGVVPPPSQEAEAFVGTWINVDEDTESIIKIRITEADKYYLSVEQWAKCYPDDCYWEPKLIKKSEIIDGTFELFWDGVAEQMFQEIKLLDDDTKLQVTTRSEYANGWVWSTVDYFLKLQ